MVTYGIQLLLDFPCIDRTHVQHCLLGKSVEFVKARFL